MQCCPICLDAIENGHTLECNHTYCAGCIVNWFRSGHQSCPMCKSSNIELDNIQLPDKDKMRIMRKYSLTNSSNSKLIKLLLKSYDRQREKIDLLEEDLREFRLETEEIREQKKEILKKQKRFLKKKTRRILALPIERIIIPVKKHIF